MGLTQTQVAKLLGSKTHKSVGRMEMGKASPSLRTALKLAALYRAPVDFLFRQLYMQLRDEIRIKEQQLKSVDANVQGVQIV